MWKVVFMVFIGLSFMVNDGGVLLIDVDYGCGGLMLIMVDSGE